MTNQPVTDSRSTVMARLPVLLLFAGSGCAALIYEIVWFQLLQLAIGSTSVSTGILLATYMGGLCVGSLALPRLIRPTRHPLMVYAALEAGTALFGLLALFEIPVIQRVYFAGAEHGLPSMLLRGAIAAICLLPPTVLMGASLPTIVRWIEATPRGISWWGLLYGGNTAGAVFGCLLAGFYLLRIHDTYVATFVAVGINLAVALISFAMAAWTGMVDVWAEEQAPPSWSTYVYVTIALSGACALGAEVIWTRLLAMMLGSTVYVFSIILAVFLIGLALGSGGASWWLRSRSDPVGARQALGWCQILLAAGIAWTAYLIAVWMPSLTNDILINGTPWQTFRIDLARCALAILPPTLLWGASFPLACAAAAGYRADAGRLVGAVYAANTLGAIVGALGVSLILVPWIGTQQSQRVLLVVSAASALFMLAPRALRSRGLAAGVVFALVAAGALAWTVKPFPGKVIAYGRRAAIADGTVIYTKEGRNSSVAITMWSDGAFEVDVNGHVEATTEPYDMKLQRMVGHLPALLHPHPRSVLGIGFGAGVSAGTFTRYPSIEHITVCEIEPVIPPTSTRYFSDEDYDVLHNPRTRIVYDDARHYILTTPEKFDIIASDPLDVFVKGTAAIYSQEYFEAVKQHLNPGGMFSLYVPLYETDERTIKSELATFFAAFPYGTIWANLRDGEGYDMVFMGQAEPLRINIDEVQERLSRPDYAPVAQSLRDVGAGSAIELLSSYAGQARDLAPWIRGAEINRDRDLRLQYLGGWGINSQMADYLYRQIVRFRRPPAGLFTGSPQTVQLLLGAMYAQTGG